MKRALALLMVFVLLLPVCAYAQPSYSLALGSQSDAVVAMQYALSMSGFLDEKYVTGYFGEITEEAVELYQMACGLETDGIAGPATLTALLGEGYRALFDVDAAIQQENNTAQNVPETRMTESLVDDGASPFAQTVPSAPQQVGSQQVQEREVDVRVQITGDGVVLSEPLVVGVKSDFVKLAQDRLAALGYLSIGETTRYFGEMTEQALIKFQRANGLTPDGVLGNATASKLMSNSAVAYSASQSYYDDSYVGGGYLGGSSGYLGSTSVPVSSIVQLAMEQLGKPYRYAARGTEAFDCSGLVYYVFKTYGVKMPTSSSAQSQYENATRITNMNALQVGDVIFFNTGNSAVVINHCGIYIGNGQFIHASSGGGKVQINSLVSDFYGSAFRWALRILG